MAEIIKDNIRFSNVPNSSAKGYTGLITNADNITDKRYVYDPESDPILMALDINWGGAEVDENKIINTTGELLTWIKEGLEAASQSGGSAELSEEQLEALNTVANLLAFIKEYALRTADADARYQAKGDYVLAATYAENQAAIDEAIAALQAANEASDITSLKNQVNTLSGLILTKVDETKVNELILAKGYQTEAQVNAAIQRVVGAAPEALDTLAEIAEVLQGKEDDENPVVGLIETVGKKANSEDVYTKEQVDAKETALQAGINTNGQAINAANAAILTKANASDVYSKAQADEKFATNEDFNTFVEEVNSANETTAEALVQLQDSIENIALTPGAQGEQGPKGDTGAQGPKGDTGAKGEDGIIGHDGKSAYELYVEANGAGYKQVRVSSNTKPDGTEAEDTSAFVGQEFLVTADAVEGDTLYPLLNGDKAEIGVSIKIVEFIDANTCRFESYNPEGTVQYGKGVAVGTGVTVDTPLSQADWLNSLKGADGAQGPAGAQGPKGDTGTFDASALEDYATKTYVSEKIAEVVGAAPETLDTLEEIATKLQEVEGITGIKGDTGEQGPKGDKGDTGEQGADGAKGDKGDTGEQGPKGDKGDTGEQGPKGDKGDTGEQGPKGDKGDTGTFDSSALAGYVTIEQYNALLARIVALEGGETGGGEPDNAYLTPTTTKPTSASIAAMTFPEQVPAEPLTLETSEITRPTELYLVYPSAWVTANANEDITNPVITDPNGFAQGAWVDSTVTVDGVSYTIIGTELGKDTYTLTFS